LTLISSARNHRRSNQNGEVKRLINARFSVT
jgi:hypothetical protein